MATDDVEVEGDDPDDETCYEHSNSVLVDSFPPQINESPCQCKRPSR